MLILFFWDLIILFWLVNLLRLDTGIILSCYFVQRNILTFYEYCICCFLWLEVRFLLLHLIGGSKRQNIWWIILSSAHNKLAFRLRNHYSQLIPSFSLQILITWLRNDWLPLAWLFLVYHLLALPHEWDVSFDMIIIIH